MIGLALIHLLFQDSASVNLTMGGSLGHKVSSVQPLLSTDLFHIMGVIRQLD